METLIDVFQAAILVVAIFSMAGALRDLWRAEREVKRLLKGRE